MKKTLLLALVVYAAGIVTYPVAIAQAPARRVIAPKTFPYMGLPYSPGILVGDTLYLNQGGRVELQMIAVRSK